MSAVSKAALRSRLRAERACVHRASDDMVFLRQLLKTEAFQNAETVLCYMALPEEIDTAAIIAYSLSHGKTVAVPYCLDRNGNMDFYVIGSFSDLQTGTFGVPEPDITKAHKVTDFSHSVCLVPGIAFDERGHRLGYGKGYYDRFLKKYSSISIGLCYNSLIQKELPIDGNDIPVNLVITENRIIGGKNG